MDNTRPMTPRETSEFYRRSLQIQTTQLAWRKELKAGDKVHVICQPNSTASGKGYTINNASEQHLYLSNGYCYRRGSGIECTQRGGNLYPRIVPMDWVPGSPIERCNEGS